MCILSFFYLKNSMIPLTYNMVSVALFLDCSSVSCHLFKNSAFHRLLRTCLCFILRSFIMPPRAIPVVTHLSNVNADSVYYVYPSEGPNSISITPQLNGLVMASFDATRSWRKNKLDFINGSILVLEIIDLNYVVWERCNYLIHSWI